MMSVASLTPTLKVADVESSMLEPAPLPKVVVVPSPWNLSIVIVFCLVASEMLYHAEALYAWYVEVVVLKMI